MERFEQIIWDLGQLLDLPLHTDENRACTLLLDEKLEVQFEMEEGEERLLVGALLGEIPPGKYRENLLREALKGNHPPINGPGILAYVERINQLMLYDLIQASSVTSEALVNYLNGFTDKALAWKAAIEGGLDVPPKYRVQATPNKPRPFGM